MANCKYILELPGGKSIELPASFGTLDKSDDINQGFANYLAEADNTAKETKLDELSKALFTQINIGGINTDTIKNIIKTSNSEDELYSNLNNKIYQFGTYENIGEAVYNYIKKGSVKGKKNENLQTLMTGLKQKRNADYFSKKGMEGVLSTTNLHEQKDIIFGKNVRNLECAVSTVITANLNTFMNALIKKYKESGDSRNNVIYGTSDSFIGLAWSNDNMVMHKLGDDLSLFLGLFKREAMKLSSDKLLPALERLNIALVNAKQKPIDLETFEMNNFFNGVVGKKGVIPSQFENLLNLGNNIGISKEIDNIISLVATSISDSENLPIALKKLFWQLNPDNYGKNKLSSEEAALKFIDSEASIERGYKNAFIPFTEIEGSQRDLFFAGQESIINGSYDEVSSKIVPYQDIALFPLERDTKGRSMYGLVTGIYPRANGIAIYGIYRNQFGIVESISHLFPSTDTIQYRRREAAIDPIEPGDLVVNVAGTTITSSTAINAKIIKTLVRKGDTVAGKLVLGVYPGYITVRDSKGKVYNNSYSSIRSLTSARASQELEIEEQRLKPGPYVQVNDSNDLSEGDYYLYKNPNGKDFYKRILYSDNKNIYSLVESKEGNIIKSTSREGLVGLKSTFGELNKSEIDKIVNELSNIATNKIQMSSFKDPKSARNGDYLYYEESDGTRKYGKVLDNQKVLVMSGKDLTNKIILSLKDVISPIFFTNRDISSNFSLFNIRANSKSLIFKPESDSVLDVEAAYVVPENTDLSRLTLLTNGYANIGTYKAKEFIKEGDRDITEHMLKALDKPKGSKVFFQKESSNSVRYSKNMDSLTWIKYFSDLDSETKEELNILQPGTYFSVYTATKGIDFNIYRIVSVDGDKVKAHLNTTSNDGKILTTEVEFTKQELLNSEKVNSVSPENSIARLYMQNGNKKMGAVIREANKLSQDRVVTNQAINDLIDKMTKYVGGLNIQVRLVSPEEGNFTKSQKAKLTTDLEGNTSILINNQIGKEEDLIHEFLHLFLTPLRYQNPSVYKSLINSIVKDSNLNVTDAEEEFVKIASEAMVNKEDFIDDFEDLEKLITGLHQALNLANPEFVVSMNPIEILNTSLLDLFEVNTVQNTHQMFSESMITVEPMMREWLKNNNIELNCT